MPTFLLPVRGFVRSLALLAVAGLVAGCAANPFVEPELPRPGSAPTETEQTAQQGERQNAVLRHVTVTDAR